MPTYADVNKSINDFFSRNFASKNSVKVSSKASNGATYTAELKGKGNKATGKVAGKFKHSSGFNLKKFEIANSGAVSSQVDLEGAVDNTVFTLDVSMQPLDAKATEKCEVGVKYSHEKAEVTLAVSPILPTAASVSVLAQHEEFLFGGSYSGALDTSGESAVYSHVSNGFVVGYQTAQTLITLATSTALSKFSVNAFHKHNADISLAASTTLVRGTDDAPGAVSLKFGGSQKIDADTSASANVCVPNGTSIDGATAAFALKQKVNSLVTLNGTATVNLDPSDDPFGASFALGVEFGA